jgi:hypothetical protein
VNARGRDEATVAEAVDAWREAKHALDAAMPWTADWLRLRMIEQDRRAAYIALMAGTGNGGDEIRVEPSRRPEEMARPEGFEPPTY